MTRDEVKQILMRLEITYPNFKIPANETKFKLMIDTWHEYLAPYEHEIILSALRAFILTDSSGFAPSVGQILAEARQLATADDMSELEAWQMVSRALRNGYYGAEQEFEKLPPKIKKAVGSPANIRNWSQADNGEVETVIMSQFLRAYRTATEREARDMMLPPDLRLAFKNMRLLEG